MKTTRQTNTFIKQLFSSLLLSTVLTHQALAAIPPVEGVSETNVIALGQSIYEYKSHPRACDPFLPWIQASPTDSFIKLNPSAISIAKTLASEIAVHGTVITDFKAQLDAALLANYEPFTAGSARVFTAVTTAASPYPNTELWFNSPMECEAIMGFGGWLGAGLGKVNIGNTSYWTMILFHQGSLAQCDFRFGTPCKELGLTMKPPVDDDSGKPEWGFIPTPSGDPINPGNQLTGSPSNPGNSEKPTGLSITPSLSDLVVTEFKTTGRVHQRSPNQYQVGVRVVVENQGLAKADMFRLGVRSEDSSGMQVVPFTVSGQGNPWQPMTSSQLDPGERQTLEGLVTFHPQLKDAVVEFYVVADDCQDSPYLSNCYIVEEDEDNNESTPLFLQNPYANKKRVPIRMRLRK